MLKANPYEVQTVKIYWIDKRDAVAVPNFLYFEFLRQNPSAEEAHSIPAGLSIPLWTNETNDYDWDEGNAG